ncbi:MAG TPA: biotin--[acetyl-CoA-carboxylase] ligase [Planctomycetota bacterium]|nr:biotin--[acetyl-CoA-carboxylase] ligase [Planctomycetota bacterium]
MLDARAIRERLGENWPDAELRVLSSVTSTSDVAWAWAEAGCPEGTAVFAEEQVRGRGRFGRTWHSPRGRDILLSVVLRPPTEEVSPAHLTALGAVAVAEAIEAEAGLRPQIRWPNDLTLGNRKVAGVLVECRGERVAPCVMGLGVNVNSRRDELPADLRSSATSLAAEAGRAFCREAIAGALLSRLCCRVADAVAGRWELVAAAWRQRASLVGQVVAVESQGRAHRGRVVAADPLRGLELELPNGERRACRAEDTTLILPGGEGCTGG